MNIKEIEIGKTGYSTGYGADCYPHTVFEIGKPKGQGGRKPYGWVKGTKVVYLGVASDKVTVLKEGETVPEGSFTCNGDTGYQGNHATFVMTPQPETERQKIKALLLPDGELKCRGLGGHYYSQDSSF